tara:strand:- start:460 stop:618 length:159 start_codon:yes stop_codon:yes gene_type:complete
MSGIAEQAQQTILSNKAKDAPKLAKQMDYYKQMKKKGLTKAQSYSLGTVSAV